MIRRMRMLLVAAGMEILAACSTNDSAGSTFETENSVAKIVDQCGWNPVGAKRRLYSGTKLSAVFVFGLCIGGIRLV